MKTNLRMAMLALQIASQRATDEFNRFDQVIRITQNHAHFTWDLPVIRNEKPYYRMKERY